PTPVDVRQLRQRAAALLERLTVTVEQRPPQPAAGAGATVHRSRAAQPHHHGCGTTLHGLPNKLAHTARRSPQRIELIGPEQRDAARSGPLEDRGLVLE